MHNQVGLNSGQSLHTLVAHLVSVLREELLLELASMSLLEKDHSNSYSLSSLTRGNVSQETPRVSNIPWRLLTARTLHL